MSDGPHGQGAPDDAALWDSGMFGRLDWAGSADLGRNGPSGKKGFEAGQQECLPNHCWVCLACVTWQGWLQ